MIVTAGGKNIYPEDIEQVFDGLPVKEYLRFCGEFSVAAENAGQRECWCW